MKAAWLTAGPMVLHALATRPVVLASPWPGNAQLFLVVVVVSCRSEKNNICLSGRQGENSRTFGHWRSAYRAGDKCILCARAHNLCTTEWEEFLSLDLALASLVRPRGTGPSSRCTETFFFTASISDLRNPLEGSSCSLCRPFELPLRTPSSLST
jgi:hypothetical protein